MINVVYFKVITHFICKEDLKIKTVEIWAHKETSADLFYLEGKTVPNWCEYSPIDECGIFLTYKDNYNMIAGIEGRHVV